MQSHPKIAVAGATGRVGHHVVDVLETAGHDVVAISRSAGVDVVTGDGLAEALEGVEVIIDTATGPSPEKQAAVDFFTASAENLQRFGEHAGVKRIVVVSIVGCDRFKGGYGAAKLVHEQALAAAGAIPISVLRATQFHEFVEALLQWGTQGHVAYVPEMRTQLIAARSVAEALAQVATDPDSWPAHAPTPEIAGPQPESLVEMAKLLVAHDGRSLDVQAVSDLDDPDHDLNVSGGLLPANDATLAGPTFARWLHARVPAAAGRR
ncbi:MAG: SDR family oxidoreductase [Solirubrobacteraceae bacterium]